MINILYEDNHLLVVEKPVNIPIQEDESKDIDLLTLCKEDLKKRYDKPGNVYLGLVHRLDRPVGGVVVFAKTSKAASRLSEQVRTHQFKKIYHAVICNGHFKESGTLVDYLVKDEKRNMVKVSNEKDSKAKKAILHYHILKQKNDLSYVEIELETGRSHQIRVQFASRNAPLWADQRYNPNAKEHSQIALWATSLTFFHPVSKEEITIVSKPPKEFPWTILEEV
ncbi:23S rRNA pseudouridine1911/1915/1917 synthase [Anaerorhabdus furcosa]|uniref:RNA pseudouridylate synthase n=2 Tax=Anaerorhabdus furcosa TaxID=118967 RepID=A0A1T4JV33_9FIRM|nr:23S rRNA pseudouridine1911/1915/1917 synthase [Anaerorhabdus furcosa]